jgi:transposase
MKKHLDGRKLDRATLEKLRIRAVSLVVEEGKSPEVVVAALGFHRSCIYDWLRRYNEGGWDALKSRPLPGRNRTVNEDMEEQLLRIVTERSPEDYGFESALWTRWMIRDVVFEEFGKRVSITTAGRILKRIGLSPQRPLRRAAEQNTEEVEAWKNTEYPRIKETARKEDAEIFFEDKAGISTTSQSGTTWSPEGETPVVETAGAGLRLNMASAISPKGGMHFMTFEGSMNSDRFIEFLKRLFHERERPVFLIADNHSAHVSKKTRDFVESTNGRLKLFTLPPYSPELNPNEQVWNHVKNHTVGKQKLNGMDDLKEKTRKALEALQRTPRTIRNFFKKPEAAYALE